MSKFIINRVDDETSITRTIRIKKTIFDKLDDISIKKNLSVNKIISMCIEYALDNMEDDNTPKESDKN